MMESKCRKKEIDGTVEVLRWSFDHGEPAGPLRRSAHAALLPWLTPDDLADAMVVVSELVQNVTQHTSSGGELVLTADACVVTIEVRDRSVVLPELRPADAHRLGGRGLLLVAGVTRAWGVRREESGKVVWARLSTSAGTRAEPAA